MIHTGRVVGQIAAQTHQISKSADTRANYKDLSVLSPDLPLCLCEYGVTGDSLANERATSL